MTSIVDTLRSRESKSYVGGRDLESRHALYDAEYAVRRLQLSHQLRAHDGCVNTIQWDASGRWLVSGSDDRRLNIWSPFYPAIRTISPDDGTAHAAHRPYLRCSLPTSHTGNIFNAKFFAGGNTMATSQTDTAFALDDYGEASFADMPTEVVSCCAGGTVQYTDLARYLRDSLHYAPPSVFQCHAEMVYDVETDPMNARCFFSCAQDGTVNLYDLRVRTSCACNGCNRHTYIDVNATPRSGGGASEVVVGRGSAQSDRRHGRHLDCKSAMGVVPHTTRRAASLPFFLQVKVTPGNLAVTSMAVRHDNPMYMSLGCSDDFVRTYDRRYLARSVHVTAAASGDGTATTSSDAATSLDEERAANLSNELPSSVRSWQGLVHEFCPSHLRRGMHTACKSIRTMSRRRGNENDDDNIVDDEEDSGVNDTDHGMTTDDTNDMYNDFGERTSIRNRRARRLDGDSDAVRTDNRASFERDDYMWHHYAHNITSLCYDPDGSGEVLVSYADERMYTFKPVMPGATTVPASETETTGVGGRNARSSSTSITTPKYTSPKRKSSEQHQDDTPPTSKNASLLAASSTFTSTPTNVRRVYSPTLFYPKYHSSYTRRYDEEILTAYAGHRNVQTMIKEARFFHYSCQYSGNDGSSDGAALGRSAYVMSGSDSGHVFFWPRRPVPVVGPHPDGDTATSSYPVIAAPSFILKGDGRVVNCVQAHPHIPALACSGIDNDIKIFLPIGGHGCEMEGATADIGPAIVATDMQEMPLTDETRAPASGGHGREGPSRAEQRRLRAIEMLVLRNQLEEDETQRVLRAHGRGAAAMTGATRAARDSSDDDEDDDDGREEGEITGDESETGVMTMARFLRLLTEGSPFTHVQMVIRRDPNTAQNDDEEQVEEYNRHPYSSNNEDE